jgi:arylformamidase
MVEKKGAGTQFSIPDSGWIDISWPLRRNMRKWPRDEQPFFDWVLERSKGDGTDMIGMKMITHTGTHVDAPLHFVENGKTIDTMSVKMMIGPARIIEIKDQESVKLAEVEPYDVQAGERIIFKTQNSYKLYDTDVFVPKYVYVTIDVAHYLRDRKVTMVGLDYIALGPYPDPELPDEKKNELMETLKEVHQSLLSNGIWILEAINLANVRPGPCILACLPLRVENGDAAPARCIVRPL